MARTPLAPLHQGSGMGADPFLQLYRDINRVFDDVFRGGDLPAGGNAMRSMVNTSMDVAETPDEFRLTAELPGVSEDDISISLNDDVLTIRGEKRAEEMQGAGDQNYHFVERCYGSFQRSLRLPTSVDGDRAEARFDNGVLTICLPKREQPNRSRTIGLSRSGKTANAGMGMGEARPGAEAGADRPKAEETASSNLGADDATSVFGRPGEGPDPGMQPNGR